MMVKIAASILSADFSRLGEQVEEAERGGADYVHIDVMDGHFVPNLTVGPLVVHALRPHSQLPFDVHLMIEDPGRYVEDFCRAGADILTVQQEACVHLHRVVQQIKEQGVRAGVAINPATPIGMLEEILPFVDQVLVMTVNPGFGGQEFITTMPDKIKAMRQLIERKAAQVEIEVDGGIHPDTVRLAVAAGAQVLVAGSAIYRPGMSVGETIRELRRRAEE